MEQDDLYMRLLELSSQGFACSQILLILALDGEGNENVELIRAMGGLNEGLCGAGKLCGALTGGCCLLGYYGSKGTADEQASVQFDQMVQDLVHWFESEVGNKYGGINCSEIIQDQASNRLIRCPHIVQAVYERSMELLHEYGCLS